MVAFDFLFGDSYSAVTFKADIRKPAFAKDNDCP